MPLEARKAFARALTRLGEDAALLLHRVAVVDEVAVAHDAWVLGRSEAFLEPEVDAGRGLDLASLRRLPKRQRNRLERHAEIGLCCVVYDGDQLLGRARLSLRGRGSARRLRAATQDLVEGFQKWRAASAGSTPRGTVVTDDLGFPTAWLLESAGDGDPGPDVTGLVRRLVQHGPQHGTLLHEGLQLRARRFDGPVPTYLVDVGPRVPLQLGADADLTPTQRQVAEYAAVGATVAEIARSLESAQETVRTHLREVYRRLDVANRVELARALEVN